MRGRRGRVAVAGAALVAVAGAGFVLLGGEGRAERERRPDVVLRRGSFEGMPWAFGTSEFTDGRPCTELVMDAMGGGCGAFRPRIRAIELYTSSSGDPSGILTAQGFVSPDVASVVTLSGGHVVGEAHVVDLPEPVAGKTQAVVAFVTEADVGVEAWVAVAFDSRSRVIGHDVI